MYLGFEEMLMAVIGSTANTNDDSDETRFRETMKALFGNFYERESKLPDGYSATDIQNILKDAKLERSLQKAILKAVKAKRNVTDAQAFKDADKNGLMKRLVNADMWRIKQYLRRNKPSKDPSAEYDYQEYFAEAEQQKAEIFAALRKADWPI